MRGCAAADPPAHGDGLITDEKCVGAPCTTASSTTPSPRPSSLPVERCVPPPEAGAAAAEPPLLYDPGVDVGRLDELLLECPTVPPDLRTVVIQRFISGADIGFRGSQAGRFTVNNRSALLRPAGVSAAIAAEVEAGTTRGPYPAPPLPGLVINPLSARDKNDGSTRLILDLSQPNGHSVNDGIDAEQFRLSYTSVNEVFRLIFAAGGTGALLAKVDIKAAFKLIPVRPDQWRLLGFQWEDQFYFQVALSFGSRSSPRIFNDFADCLEGLFQQRAGEAEIRKYLDDFWLVAPPGSPDADRAYRAMHDVCTDVRVPLAVSKCVAPTTSLTLLGIQFDTAAMTVGLPQDKLQALRSTIGTLLTRRKCTKRELLSIVGRLVHAAKCVPPGRAFTRRLLDLACSVAAPLHRVRLTAAARADLQWWAAYLPRWSGTFPLLNPDDQATDTVCFTDSSRWCTGACCGTRWWYFPWPETLVQGAAPSMTWLELIPLLVSCLLWGDLWGGQRIRVYSDNMGVVGCVTRGWSGDPRIMSVLRHLLFVAACKGCMVSVNFVPTAANGPADSLSRGDLPRFHRLRPHAMPVPDTVPVGLDSYLREPESGPGVVTGVQL